MFSLNGMKVGLELMTMGKCGSWGQTGLEPLFYKETTLGSFAFGHSNASVMQCIRFLHDSA